MNMETIFRRFKRRIEDMDSYEKTRFYTIIGMSLFAIIFIIGLIVFVSLRNLDVVIGVDTTGLLGKPAVFINNTSNSTLRNVYVEMDDKYTAKADKIKPRQSVVLYFTSFTPLPPPNYRPLKVKVKSGLGVKVKNIPRVSK
jgi:hypothetical protein